jgi:hypothetical protein
MNMNMKLALVAFAAMAGVCLADTVVDFNGQSTTGNNTAFSSSIDGSHDWTDNGVTFSHEVSWGGFAWDGMTYSSVNDTTTAGFGNQYAVYGDGMGVGDSGSYGVYTAPFTPRSVITLPVATTVQGFYANNTTYAALSMLNGDDFARQFTTASNDWFKLTVEGFDASAVSQGTVDFFLADYTGETGSVVDDWAWVDLSGLGGNVSSLGFSLSSSDNGDFGMNTPAYFAMDNLTVEAIPEPGTIVLMLLSAGGLVGVRRFRI